MTVPVRRTRALTAHSGGSKRLVWCGFPAGLQWSQRFPLRDDYFPRMQLSPEEREKLLATGRGLVPVLLAMTETNDV